MPFFSKDFATTVAPKESAGGDRYLNPSSIEDGGSVRFCILSEAPLEGYEVWFNKRDGGMTKRITPDYPDDELLSELCAQLNAEVSERDGRRSIKRCASFFVYDYDLNMVRLFSANQKTLLADIERLVSDPDYSELAEWDMKLSRTGKLTDTKYHVSMHPTKRSNAATGKAVITAWDDACKAGYSLEALLDGGNPFGEAK